MLPFTGVGLAVLEAKMSVFGKCGGGGRRRASREPMPLPAVVSTVDESRALELVDLSATGAKLRGRNLPEKGEAMWVKIEDIRRFAMCIWTSGRDCGVEFDTPIDGFDVERVRCQARVATLSSGSLMEQLAMEDWESGFAR